MSAKFARFIINITDCPMPLLGRLFKMIAANYGLIWINQQGTGPSPQGFHGRTRKFAAQPEFTIEFFTDIADYFGNDLEAELRTLMQNSHEGAIRFSRVEDVSHAQTTKFNVDLLSSVKTTGSQKN